MSDPGPLDPDENPFAGLPFLGDLAKLLGAQGGFRWDTVQQVAVQLATGGVSEPNPDPMDRMRLEQLVRVAELHVAELTGLDTSLAGRPIAVTPVNRAGWVTASSEAYRPLLEALAASLGKAQPQQPDDDIAGDPMSALFGNLMGALAPMMLSMTAGSMLGHLAQRSFGSYDLPVPRPPGSELVVVPARVHAFAEEWSLSLDDLFLWLCVREVATHAVLRVPHVRDRIGSLLTEFADGFEPGGAGLEGLEGAFAGIDPSDPSTFAKAQEALSDPEVLLGAVRSEKQRALLPRLESVVAVVVGYVDRVLDEVGQSLIPSYTMLTEALRRDRVEAGAANRFLEGMLGLELSRATYERGNAFITGVLDRAGPEGLDRLWHSERELPTPAEIDAPGLWLARIDLDE